MECTIVYEPVHIQVSPLKAKDAAERDEVVNKIMAAVLNRACPTDRPLRLAACGSDHISIPVCPDLSALR